jgi:hypothetical protein
MKNLILSLSFISSIAIANSIDPIKAVLSKVDQATNDLRAQGTFIRPSIIVLPTIATPDTRFSRPRGLNSTDIIQVINSGFCSFSRFDIKEGPRWLSRPFSTALNQKNTSLPHSLETVDRVGLSFLRPEDKFNDEFSKNIESVAQATLADAFLKIFNTSDEAQNRATALLSESDENSMLSDKAKLTGSQLITQEQIELANNASYIAIPVVEQSIHETIYTMKRRRLGQEYKIRMGAYLFKVNKLENTVKLTLISKSMYNGESTVIDSTYAQDVLLYSPSTSKDEYNEAEALNSVLFKFQSGLKEISEFQLGSQIYNSDGQDFAFDTRKSEVEDISMDDKYWMKEMTEEEDGSTSWEYLGWSNITGTPRNLDTSYISSNSKKVKARLGNVTDYCVIKTKNDYSQQSNKLLMFEAEAVTGTPEEGALVEEVVRVDLDLQLSFKKHQMKFMVGDTIASPNQANSIDIQFKTSIAENYNTPNLNFITRLSASIINVTLDSIVAIEDQFKPKVDLDLVGTVGITFGVQKGFYLWRFFPYIQLGLGYKMAYIIGSADTDSEVNSNFNAYRNHLGAEFEVGSAFFFTPNVSLNAAVGHQAYLNLGSFDYSITEGEEDIVDNQETDLFDKSSFNGLTYYLGLTFNTWPLFKYF